MVKKGKFIVIDGVGGSGKSTQIPLAEKYLKSLGRTVVCTREPGGVEAAESIRELIFKLREKGIASAEQQAALFFAARHLWVNEVVAGNISKGVDVLTDRSYTSTAAYQGYAEGADIEMIGKWVGFAMGEYMPNGIILLDISVEEAKRRSAGRDSRDPYDEEKPGYFRKVVNGYRQMAREGWSGVPWYVVNGEQEVSEVARDVRLVLDKILSVSC